MSTPKGGQVEEPHPGTEGGYAEVPTLAVCAVRFSMVSLIAS
jgi:hypothetical protein